MPSAVVVISPLRVKQFQWVLLNNEIEMEEKNTRAKRPCMFRVIIIDIFHTIKTAFIPTSTRKPVICIKSDPQLGIQYTTPHEISINPLTAVFFGFFFFSFFS